MLLNKIRIFILNNSTKVFNFFLFLSIFSLLFLWDLKIGNELINTRTFFIFLTIFIVIFQLKKFEIKNLIFYLLVFISLIAHLYLTNYEKKIITISDLAPIFYITVLFLSIDLFFEKIYKYIYLSSKFFVIILGTYMLVFSIHTLIFGNIINQNQVCGVLDVNLSYSIIKNSYFIKIFLEPSHFAMSAVGPFVWSIYNYKKVSDKEYFVTIFLISLLILLYTSMTLLAGILFSIICIFFSNYTVIMKKYKKITFITLLLFFSIILLKNDCSSRITRIFTIDQFERETQTSLHPNLIDKLNIKKDYEYPNLTSDVYRVNLLITVSSIETFPFGVGINNYEFVHKTFSKLISKRHITPEAFYLNFNDARSNFFKLLSEFGIFSLIIFLYLIYFMFSKKIPFEIKTIFCGLVVTQMASGAGYFNGGFIFIIIFSIILVRKKSFIY